MAQKNDYNSILQRLYADYRGVNGTEPDLLTRILFVAMASAFWAAYKAIDWALDQCFPDTASTKWLIKLAKRKGIDQASGEQDDSLLQRLTFAEQSPVAGGNGYDWAAWAKEVSITYTNSDGTMWDERVSKKVTDEWVFENARTFGTVDIVIIGDYSAAPAYVVGAAYETGDIVNHGADSYVATGSGTSSGESPVTDAIGWDNITEIASDDLAAAVKSYIDLKRALGAAYDNSTIPATRKVQDVSMEVVGDALTSDDLLAIRDQIDASMRLPILRPLNVVQLSAIAVAQGAEDATVIVPSGNVTVEVGPETYERIWPGTISVVKV